MTNRDPTLQPASASDLPEILALLQRCQLLEAGVAEAIGNFIVAREEHAVLGCAGLEAYGELGLLRSVAVDGSVRRAGLGRRLVESIARVAREQGLRELFLLTTTAPAFFERLGFAPIARASVPTGIAGSWEFRVGCPQTALPMRCTLEGRP